MMNTVKKSNKMIDMIHGPLGKKILLMALPLAATGILQQVFNAADVAIVGRFVGKEAMAAVGANSAIVGMIVNFFVGIALGTNVAAANAIGRKDVKALRKTVHTSILIALIGGLLVAIAGELCTVPLLHILRVPEEILPMAAAYLRVYLVGLPVIFLYNFEAAVFRAKGDTRTPLIILGIAGALNVVLNLFFVLALRMTADGVALATVLSNAVSALALLLVLIRTEDDTKVTWSELKIDQKVCAAILRVGLPAAIQTSMFTVANLIIQAAINSLGTTVVAASSAAYNLEQFAYLIIVSFGQTCTTFVAQNYGAGKPERCRTTLRICLLQDAVCTAGMIILILAFGHQLLAIFNPDPDVIANGYVRLIYIFITYIFSLPNEAFSGYLRGFRMSSAPAVISIIGICGVRLVWIFTVFRQSRTFATIMTAFPISLCVTTIAVIIATLILRPSVKGDR